MPRSNLYKKIERYGLDERDELSVAMAHDRNWDKELAKIDKQLESMSDEALLPAKTAARRRRRKAEAAAEVQGKHDDVVGRRCCGCSLAVALGVGMIFWPYASRCGAGLVALPRRGGRR